MDNSPNSPTYPPSGITQVEWQEMSTSERAALVYRPVPDSFEDDDDVHSFRLASRGPLGRGGPADGTRT